ncbi:LacI family DNA-binding transcriptional regulator [Paenibacillus cymbidii]|uniref:LacI family DNA-binding transcriptional regulator n=1 Tax=Paenibacillus cymbidii TaxID=1639034 RepID=UPI001436C613|nr:LacI family DNA-binding transcriptional regulator [Paenibacillus cymbidii]
MTEMKGRKKKPTVKAIADRTGFSPATVSLVLNGKGSFMEETRQAIVAALSELGGVQPDSGERAAAGKSDRPFVRLLIEETDALFTTDPYNSEIIMGIEQECRAAGIDMMLSFVRADSDPLQAAAGASGLIAIGGGLITDSFVERLQHTGVPLVLVDNYTHRGHAASVHADHYGAGFLATQHLIALGHRRIGFISGPAKYKPLVDRFAGYCAALAGHGLPLEPSLIATNVDRRFVKGYEEMKALMSLEERPTAVFAVSDRSALGAVEALKDMGLAHGQDVVLVGCDDIAAIRDVEPPIATVHVPRQEVGQMAVRFLLEGLKGNMMSGRFVIPGWLVDHP